ncbi:UDP-glucose 4-epimerase [anaerobic digester metagenome]
MRETMGRKVILITGVNGFLGAWVARRLACRHRVVGIGRSAQSLAALDMEYHQVPFPTGLPELLAVTRPDVVVHCAGSASVPFSVAHPDEDFQAGPGLVANLLEAVKQSRLMPTIVFPSSAAVYGNPQRLPVAECSMLQPISPYGRHKIVSETLLRDANADHGIPFLILRIFSGYGAGLRKQLLWDAAGKMMAGDLVLHGSGRETRDYIHAWDVARLIDQCIERDVRNVTLNVAQGKGVTVRELVELLTSHLAAGVSPRFSGKVREGDPLYWQADVSHLADLGFSARVTLAEGVAHFASWYLAEQRSGGYVSVSIPAGW